MGIADRSRCSGPARRIRGRFARDQREPGFSPGWLHVHAAGEAETFRVQVLRYDEDMGEVRRARIFLVDGPDKGTMIWVEPDAIRPGLPAPRHLIDMLREPPPTARPEKLDRDSNPRAVRAVVNVMPQAIVPPPAPPAPPNPPAAEPAPPLRPSARQRASPWPAVGRMAVEASGWLPWAMAAFLAIVVVGSAWCWACEIGPGRDGPLGLTLALYRWGAGLPTRVRRSDVVEDPDDVPGAWPEDDESDVDLDLTTFVPAGPAPYIARPDVDPDIPDSDVAPDVPEPDADFGDNEFQHDELGDADDAPILGPLHRAIPWKWLTAELFEQFLADLFRRQGYRVKIVGRANDHGVDLIIQKPMMPRIAVQAKGYTSGKVGASAIYEVYFGAKHHHRCRAFWVVTNSTFTKGAKERAAKVGCRLYDESDIREWLSQTSGRRWFF